MKKVLFALAVTGFVLLVLGITIAFANPLVASKTIRCTGSIGYLNEESKSQTYVDATGFIPIIAGVGLLSIAFLNGRFKKE